MTAIITVMWRGNPESLVALSACFGGFQGILQVNDVAYEIKPMISSTKFEHLVYKMDSGETQFPTMKPDFMQEDIVCQLEFQKIGYSTQKQSNGKKESWWVHRFTIEMVVVVDHTLHLHYKRKVSKLQEHLYSMVNIVDSIYEVLDLTVLMLGMEVWTKNNPTDIDNVKTSLKQFCYWKAENLTPCLSHDTGHLFMNKALKGLSGLGFVKGMCKSHHSTAIVTWAYKTLAIIATAIALHIGHNSGVFHETCCHTLRCIVDADNSPITKFSNCSFASFWAYSIHETRCLFHDVYTKDMFARNRCGNGVFGDEEECDCGSLQSCPKDACCLSNCTLSLGSHCAFGLCCKDCKFLPSGLCGRIQCENVDKIPLLRDHSVVHCIHVSGLSCWGLDYHVGMTIPDIGDMKEGFSDFLYIIEGTSDSVSNAYPLGYFEAFHFIWAVLIQPDQRQGTHTVTLPVPPSSAVTNATHGGSTMAVGELLVPVRIPLLVLRLGLFLFLPAWSQVGHCQPHGPPEVVIPLRHDSGVRPPGWISYSLHFGGQRHVVHMKVKKFLLSRHLPVFTYTDQGALLEDQFFVPNDCYYHGYVEGDPDSLVVLSTCFGGFQGTLHTKGIAYAIEPKRLSTTFEHLIYKMDHEETQSSPMRCGLTDEEIARQLEIQESDKSTLLQSGYEGWWTHKRFLELAVVVDNNRYVHSMSNISVVQKEVCLVVNDIGSYLSSLDIDVVLMGIEVWTEQNPVAVNNIGSLLSGFCRWKKGSFNTRLPHDIAHVFVKEAYGIQVGLAYVGTVCNINYNCGVASFMNDNFYDFALIVSHEIGHNLGMPHDNRTCKCEKKTCIMFAGKSSTSRFSNCSYGYLWSTIAKTTCLHSPPNLENIFTLTHCGNSVVEDGEECDCGPLQLCAKDPCCQSNCTLMPGAACAFGRCCKDCQILPSGSVCRGQVNECDLPEWCNGTSHQCPEDAHVQDGVPCMDAGLCYGRQCHNRDEQCRRIFGREAKSASEICYRALNTRGDRFGHCGFSGSQYVQCNTSDVLCGRVQCTNVARIPLLRDHSTVHFTHVNGVTCWGTDYHLGMTIPDVGDVKDGTECGAGRICLQQSDLPSPGKHLELSPSGYGTLWGKGTQNYERKDKV
ncbi:hypothetical protein MC885_007298 [Smutsia gigantea]|nr:hypothetical protein MC885_007298 [Smutsia gigantea]